MTNIPPPSPDEGQSSELAAGEEDFFSRKPNVPEIAESQKKLIGEIDDLRKVVFSCARFGVRVALLLVIAAIVIWAFHLLAPQGYRWLDAAEVNQLQSIVFSGAISALATLEQCPINLHRILRRRSSWRILSV